MSAAASLPGGRRLLWIAVGLWIAGVSWLNAPRLGYSLWNDEEATARSHIVGRWLEEEDGSVRVERVGWVDTLFSYARPGNHVLYSILARACHALAPEPVDAGAAIFSEPLLRLPAFLAGMAALAAMVWVGCVLSCERLGLVAMLLFSLHPQFTRFTTEARGYGLLYAFAPLMWAAALKAVADGRWRWWMLLAAASMLSLWTWPMALHLVLPAQLATLCLIWSTSLPRPDQWTLVSRWFITHTLAAMVFLQIFLPDLVQLRLFMKGEGSRAVPIDAAWLWDALCLTFTGSSWKDWNPSNPLFHCWERVHAVHPAFVWLGGAFLAVLFFAGCFRMLLHHGRRGQILLLAWLGPVVLIALQGRFGGSVMLPWYFAPALPGLAFTLAAGVEQFLCAFTSEARGGRLPQAALAGLVCIAFAGMTHTRRQRLREHSMDPNREAALLARRVLNPWHPGFAGQALIGGFHMQLDPYAAGMRVIKDLEGLHRCEEEARRQSRACCVIVAHLEEAAQIQPQVAAELQDEEHWERLGTLWGTEPFFSRTVFRARE